MAKQTVTLHMYERTEDWNRGQKTVDPYDFRKLPECMGGRIWIGQVDVEIDFPDIDTTQAHIDQLEKEVQKERADSQVRVNLLLDRIGKLKCLTHEVVE